MKSGVFAAFRGSNLLYAANRNYQAHSLCLFTHTMGAPSLSNATSLAFSSAISALPRSVLWNCSEADNR